MSISAKRQFLVSVTGSGANAVTITGNFTTFTGGDITSDVNKFYPGGTKTPEIMTSPSQYGNVVLSRGYDAGRDAPVIKALRALVGTNTASFTVSVQPTDRDLIPIGTANTYSNALLVRINEPDADANSGEPAMFELEFAVTSAAS